MDKYGYRALPTLAFDPDELRALQDVTARLTTLGVTSLLDDARSALRKLGADLPLNGTDAGPEATVTDPVPPTVISDVSKPVPCQKRALHRSDYDVLRDGVLYIRTVPLSDNRVCQE